MCPGCLILLHLLANHRITTAVYLKIIADKLQRRVLCKFHQLEKREQDCGGVKFGRTHGCRECTWKITEPIYYVKWLQKVVIAQASRRQYQLKCINGILHQQQIMTTFLGITLPHNKSALPVMGSGMRKYLFFRYAVGSESGGKPFCSSLNRGNNYIGMTFDDLGVSHCVVRTSGKTTMAFSSGLG